MSGPQRRHIQQPLYLAKETLTGLLFMHRYRFLTIAQFARVSGFSSCLGVFPIQFVLWLLWQIRGTGPACWCGI